jgi:serine/alanine adding enzyme
MIVSTVRKIKIVTECSLINKNEWHKFILNHTHGNYFQSYLAYELFLSVENYRPILFVSHQDDIIKGVLLGVLIRENCGIKGFFSRRCIVWGGPIVYNEDKNVLTELLQKLNEYASNKSIYIEFRNMFNLSGVHDIFHTMGYSFDSHLNFIINIRSLDYAWKNLSESKKRQINKSHKYGASIVQAETLDQIEKFYAILQILYNDKVRKPLPGFDYFAEFYKSNKYGIYLLVKYNDKIIGGIMCPIFRDTIYELYICGLDGVYKNIYPSVMATWAAVEYAAKNGLKYFDFLGAGKPNENYGVREFKSKFGGYLVNYGRFLKVNDKLLYNIGKVGMKVLERVK